MTMGNYIPYGKLSICNEDCIYFHELDKGEYDCGRNWYCNHYEPDCDCWNDGICENDGEICPGYSRDCDNIGVEN